MFSLPNLPYKKNALEPFISEKTLSFHYGKHHQTYVDKLNMLLNGHELNNESLETIIQKSSGPLFNNAAQVWNHTFYWESLSDQHHQKPGDQVNNLISQSFGSFDEFVALFNNAALNLFGSGWVWLIYNTETQQLAITQTNNAQTPLTEPHQQALFTCDVWEHAYYLDTQNSRPEYLKNFWQVLNWKKVTERLEAATTL
ncbi:superoxide dismutase [Candidatus Comchoanobacter bicostacola]|uniref:Superoxide dismutase n=1 Tax=Candidatus Comchoanobacter bicostacola TaxID=2919598 RepID=A0ABY5DL16_9GAMM|nr:superoxide dismutase [Candidatus Comchoanobacter bicostacola]UTC24647.1 superoxide dismutase [Candidatus Comchoanobacter bicostacola]